MIYELRITISDLKKQITDFVSIHKDQGWIGRDPYVLYWIGRRTLLKIGKLWLYRTGRKVGILWQG